jgi:hypothetical protein
MRLEVDWDPHGYLLEQFSSIVDLGSTIVIAKHQSSVYATTCKQYLEQVWPALGSHILSVVQELIDSEQGRTDTVLKGASVNLRLVGNKTLVIATGTLVPLNDIFEVIIWLGTACRASRDANDISICEPIAGSDEPTTLSFKVRFELRKIPQQHNIDVPGTCWRAMFRNPVITQGYPTPTRYDNENGLEVSPEMMVILTQTPSIVCCRGRLLLKGFNSALAPTHRTNNSVLWHFVVNTRGEHLLYKEGIVHSVLSSYQEAFFLGARHFIGWTDSVEIVPGKFQSCSRVA